MLKLEDRWYIGEENIYDAMEKDINYSKVDIELEKHRKESKEYLDNAIKNSFIER